MYVTSPPVFTLILMTFVLWSSLFSWQCFLNSAPRNTPTLFLSLLLSFPPPLSPLPQVLPHFPPHSTSSFHIFDHIFSSSSLSQLLPTSIPTQLHVLSQQQQIIIRTNPEEPQNQTKQSKYE